MNVTVKHGWIYSQFNTVENMFITASVTPISAFQYILIHPRVDVMPSRWISAIKTVCATDALGARKQWGELLWM